MTAPRRRGFTMVELATVLVIVGVIAVIAIPRFEAAADRARRAALKDNLRVMDNAVDMFRAEHGDMSPARFPDGTVVGSEKDVILRLTEKTDEQGSGGGIFGPYILKIPVNPYNKLDTMRIDGAPAGSNEAGWRYSSAREMFQADDSVLSAAITSGDATLTARGEGAIAEAKGDDVAAAAAVEGLRTGK